MILKILSFEKVSSTTEFELHFIWFKLNDHLKKQKILLGKYFS